MTALNLSTNGPSITKSYQSIINSLPPSGAASASPTYGQWAVFSVSAPLMNAFQQNAPGKESVLKVQSTGEGELADLIDEFSDGKVMFAFVKVKDSNTSLPKYALIGWCGEGVPERTKGYFTSYSNAVVKVLHGYHVQITARSDRDLTPEGIVQKVADASGSKYSAGTAQAAPSGPPPPSASKPVFTPTRSTGGARGFNPLAATGTSSTGPRSQNADQDGWGQDAPPVTRSQLEKVQSAYQPTKVNMAELTSQKRETPRFNGSSQGSSSDRPDVVRGAYQPVGKVDIAAIRAQAQQKDDDRPATVKGAYEPVGKVDIAAIRAKAQGPSQGTSSPPSNLSPAATGTSTLSDRSAPFASERLTTLPKPKVANKFGSSANTFGGTKHPAPGGFGYDSRAAAPAPPAGVGRSFANEAGKSPAQIWAEKKAKERGESGLSTQPSGGAAPVSPLMNQTSGGQSWKSGYTGKSWAPVSTTKTGGSASDINQQHTGGSQELEREEPQQAPSGGISSLRDKFANAPPMGAGMPASNDRSAPSPPPLDTSNKPNASRGIPMPGLPQRQSFNDKPTPSMPVPPPAQPPRSPTPPTPQDSGSPIRVAMPLGRGSEPEVANAREEQMSPPPAMPMHALSNAIPQQHEQEEEEDGHAAARGAGAAVAASAFGHEAVQQAQPGAEHSGKTAVAQYDYEKAEDNELELKEGEHVTNIEMVDDDWWMGQNSRGEVGLFPSNYVELVEGGDTAAAAPTGHTEAQHEEEPEVHHAAAAAEPEHHGGAGETGATATAIYDYEAAEDNELGFPDGAKVTNVEFPDDDWWSGKYGGKAGLFPANYVKLDG